MLSFATVFWSIDTPLAAQANTRHLSTFLYFGGVTFFTLGYGDVVPTTTIGWVEAIAEVATGFSFLALIIGYLPMTYQVVQRREVNISLLDARAGSPPIDPRPTVMSFTNEIGQRPTATRSATPAQHTKSCSLQGVRQVV